MTDNSQKSFLSGSKAGMPSNEELIDELTKDIEKSCTTDKKHKDSKPSNFSDYSPDSNVKEDDFSLDDSGDDESKPELESEKEEEDDLDDAIDEEALKQLESTYSEEDKELAKQEAIRRKDEGNEKFKIMAFLESAEAYTAGLKKCPLCFTKERAILYANRAAAKIQLKLKAGGIKDCTKAVELEPTYIKPYIRRAKLYEETKKLEEALDDHKTILKLDPKQGESYKAIPRLEKAIEIRNDEMKKEMFGKLKDLGNMFLRPFGLSTENFQVQQDPNTGGYSVNFTQNPRQ